MQITRRLAPLSPLSPKITFSIHVFSLLFLASWSIAGASAGLTEDFENGAPGWTFSGRWHLADPADCADTNPNGGIQSFYFGLDASCDYNTTEIESGELISPEISGLDATSLLLFRYWREVEFFNTPFDATQVEVLHAGGATTVFLLDAATLSSATWKSSGPISLAAFTGQTIRLRFHFDTVDEIANSFVGWFIDDVVVTGSEADEEDGCLGTLFAVHDEDLGDSGFLRLDLASGGFEPLGPPLLGGNYETLDLDPVSGLLFAISATSGQIVAVDPASGQMTPLGSTPARGTTRIAATAFHPITGEYWGFQWNKGLVTIALPDGELTLEWPISGSGLPKRWGGLAWDPDGTFLYGVHGQKNSYDPSFLMRWDPATHTATIVCGNLPPDVEALAFDLEGKLVGASYHLPVPEAKLFSIAVHGDGTCSTTPYSHAPSAPGDVPADLEGLAFMAGCPAN